LVSRGSTSSAVSPGTQCARDRGAAASAAGGHGSEIRPSQNDGSENDGSVADKEKLRRAAAILERAGEQPGGGLVASMLARAMAAQGPRKAEGAPATAQWVRYLDSASNDYYFVNAASNATVWDLPAGDTCIDENGVRVSPTSGGNGTKARFQILNPYLVSRGSVSE
jgi:3'-phosphoadenosine 5'-phosphosulfate (PAPS) 3'-phosphatase